MEGVSENKNIRSRSWLRFLLTVALIIMTASVINKFRLRMDLTEDKRYTLSAPTRKILSGIKNDIFIQVYLDGEMPIPLKRLRRSVMEMLDEFRIASGRKIDYEFINPADNKDAGQRDAEYNSLYKKGLRSVDIRAVDNEGSKTQKLVFPGMIVNYNGAEIPVNFLKNNRSISYEQNILHSIEGLEYEMIQTIATVTSDSIKKIAFLEGQGEYSEPEVADVTLNLAKFFTIDRGSIGGKPGILDKYAALIVAGPSKEFSEPDKLVIDQYIMSGGKVLWLLEEVPVNADSLKYNGETVGLYHPLNVEDQLFRYGVRINPEIIQDIDCAVIPVSVATGSEQKQIIPAPWLYDPLLTPNQDNSITKNINKVAGNFVNSIDTVGLDPQIKKTVLLSTSEYTRTLSPPLLIRLKEIDQKPQIKDFNKKNLPVAVLLEGIFPSAFRNRMTGAIINDRNFKARTTSERTKMVVAGDGDIIRNDVKRVGNTVEPYSLGQDKYTGEVLYGNLDFIINCINYLVDDNGLLALRSRELKMRLLDKSKIRSEKTVWQIVNIAGPIIIVILAGLLYGFFRKRMYTRY